MTTFVHFATIAVALLSIVTLVSASETQQTPGAASPRARHLPATPSIFRMLKPRGVTQEMCLMSIYLPRRRLPASPDAAAMAPVVDLMPWDACFFAGPSAAETEPYTHLTAEAATAEEVADEDGDEGWIEALPSPSSTFVRHRMRSIARRAKLAFERLHMKYFYGGFPGAKRVSGSIVIIDDSNMCPTERKIYNLMRGGAKGVVLYSASAALPKLGRDTAARIPVFAVGPARYRQMKGHSPIRRAVAYLPRKTFDPSMLVLIAMATVTFAVGGVMSGTRSLRSLSSAMGDYSSPLGSPKSSRTTIVDRLFLWRSSSPSSSASQSNHTTVQSRHGTPRGVTSILDTSRPVTPWAVTKMVALMSLFLVVLYALSDYFFMMDIFMYFVVAPQQLVTFLDPLFVHIIPTHGIRIPALSVLAMSMIYHWVEHRYEPGAWIFQNLLGMIMAINGLNETRFPSMQTISWALVLLFLYDVFFVFVTPFLTADGVSIMEKVASSSSRPAGDGVDGVMRAPTWPNVLVVPGYNNPMKVCNIHSFVLLGVGDIFWPGLVSSYCYAFDKVSGATRHPYFLTATASYLLGLLASMTASFWMESGQPALFYIVPSLLVPLVLVAKARSELGDFWAGSLLTT